MFQAAYRSSSGALTVLAASGLHGCNWNDGNVPYSELETVLHREVSSAVAIYCSGPQKTNLISGLIDRKLILARLP
jgi:hypothetical protein